MAEHHCKRCGMELQLPTARCTHCGYRPGTINQATVFLLMLAVILAVLIWTGSCLSGYF